MLATILVPVALSLALHSQRIAATATHISFTDLKSINETCKGEELCGSSLHTVAIPSAKCVCDEDCQMFGDCCRDSPFFKMGDIQGNPFACVGQSGTINSYYMVARCPPDTDPALRQLCENPGPSPDPFTNNLPVTVPSSDGTKVTYLNTNCARCNRASNLFLGLIWTPALACSDDFPSTIDKSKMKLVWDPLLQWTVPFRGSIHRCEVTFRIPGELASDVRACRKDVIDKCVDGWQDTYEERLCRSYTAYVIANSTLYRNVYCAQCNNETNENLSCFELSYRESGAFAPFTILLRDPEKDQVCKTKNEIYDAVFDKCRNIVCPDGQVECTGSDTKDPGFSRGSNESRIESCKKVMLEKEAFKLFKGARMVWVPKYERNFTEGEFLITESGKVEICIDDLPQTLDRYSAVMGIITLAGLGLSVFFLILHLCAVTLVSELRNHSGMNLTSLCVALIGAHSSFIAGGFLKSGSQRSCSIAAVSTYFFFMSAFFWMLVLAFDVWRVLRGAVRQFRTSQGRQWRRFLVYSLFAWGVPALLTTIALLVETAPPRKIDERFRPRFGEDSCWFSRRLPLVVFFATPLAVIMVLNMIFFTSSAMMAATTRMASASANVSGHRRDFRLYLRLAILLGLTWVVGLLASVLNLEFLWIGFVLFNTLQGLFIFVMFTCTSKVVDSMTRPHPWTNRLRRSLKLPPSKPIALLPSDTSQSTSETTMKSSGGNTTVESSYPSSLPPSRKSSTANQLDISNTPRRASP